MSHAAPVPTPPPPSPHLSNLKLSSMHVGLARRREPGTTLSHLYTVQTCELHKREHNSLHRDYTWIHNLWWITGQECDLPGSSLDSTLYLFRRSSQAELIHQIYFLLTRQLSRDQNAGLNVTASQFMFQCSRKRSDAKPTTWDSIYWWRCQIGSLSCVFDHVLLFYTQY